MGIPPVGKSSDPIPPWLLPSPNCPHDTSGVQDDDDDNDAMERSILAQLLTEAVGALFADARRTLEPHPATNLVAATLAPTHTNEEAPETRRP